jgi:hypothetical protein
VGLISNFNIEEVGLIHTWDGAAAHGVVVVVAGVPVCTIYHIEEEGLIGILV